MYDIYRTNQARKRRKTIGIIKNYNAHFKKNMTFTKHCVTIS